MYGQLKRWLSNLGVWNTWPLSRGAYHRGCPFTETWSGGPCIGYLYNMYIYIIFEMTEKVQVTCIIKKTNQLINKTYTETQRAWCRLCTQLQINIIIIFLKRNAFTDKYRTDNLPGGSCIKSYSPCLFPNVSMLSNENRYIIGARAWQFLPEIVTMLHKHAVIVSSFPPYFQINSDNALRPVCLHNIHESYLSRVSIRETRPWPIFQMQTFF